ncbi:hypothetical protein KL930_001252 [Ogataea haglerorum]|uniref:Large ribosomal subunit protein mL50 n=1 Tax=Ogataea haglerorum TaxID=1937702 RepID=A0AAN6I0N3_9ASCO|nr:uncharacterized protein KL911_003653 [Ogataea haglerorum]KAG7694929.1 hypothetical protein KL915_003162 [Ogataea haglerorum]KAG7698474.1 hypothetical protein KL951_001738 [Ogataea haglerorum]KAG7706254.1 hypothetical protein KL914_003149 [Ogataea haglerorum]KAG7708033.1 hypothetical protein KL950_002659 [Ogataea haglerorum]KAG7717169.1 hypothetical protein KL913_002920 [Ogataea haglerorum]
MLRARGLLVSARQFHNSVVRPSVLDYFRFYRKKDTVPETPTKDTKEVIKEIETKTRDPVTSNKIVILGKHNSEFSDEKIAQKAMEGFVFTTWLPRKSEFSKRNNGSQPYQEVVSELLTEIFKIHAPSTASDIKLDDLALRFKILKDVQIKFGTSIPDIKLSQLDSFDKIERYLVAKLDPKSQLFNEKVPDAVHLDPKEFEGTNITVGEYVFESQKRKEVKKLYRKAKKAEQKAIQEALSDGEK